MVTSSKAVAPLSHAARAAGLMLLAGLLAMAGWSRPAVGQGIIDRYLHARFLEQARKVLATHGPTVAPQAPARLPTSADSLLPPPPVPTAVEEEGGVQITERRVVRRLEQGWFEQEFGDTPWSFLGNSSSLSPLDTTFTRTLRAQLEAHFGPPTRTLAEMDLEEPVEDNIQFEYWFVVNDTIPAIVMDVHGPYDRGLIIATDRRFRSELRAFRDALLAPLLDSAARKPYVDYFYDTDVAAWYRTGYDGVDYFIEPVPRHQIVSGRRPSLDDVIRTAGAPSETTSSEASSQ